MNNNFHISLPVTGLIKREDYKFDIVGLGGNWPAIATPASGIFTARSKGATINTSITFLPTTGYAPNALAYNTLSCGYDNTEIFTNVAAKITSLSDNSIVYSEPSLVKCSGCLPNISVTISGCGSQQCNQYKLTNTNIFDFSSIFSGLEPNEKYNYSIKSIGSNWPTLMITPTGGSFIPNTNNYSIKHKLLFCPYSGNNLCGSSGLLDYNLAQCFNKNNLYTNIELSISPTRCNNEKIFSNSVLINCNDCLPGLSVSLPSKISLTTTNIASITGTISGLIPNTTYNYIFDCIDSNWPSILKPISGSFTAKSIKESLSAQLMFCHPSGQCTSGTNDLLPYTPDNTVEKYFNQKKLYTNLALNVTSDCGDDATSKTSTISCDNCLPCVKYANAIFSGSPIITLASGCCQGQRLISVNVTSAVPGDQYTYSFSHVPSTGIQFLNFSPETGTVYFGSGGNGKVYTVVSTDLSNFAHALLNFELIHTDTNTKVVDTIGLTCISGNCAA